jgi:hypothetical protein
MTDAARQDLIREAVTIARTVVDLDKRLATLKATLLLEAMRQEHIHLETKGGGQSVVLSGQECICRVVFPGRSLAASVKKIDPEYPKIVAACGPHFRELFRPETVIKPVKDFRELAAVLLAAKAGPLIALLESDSKPTVSFEVTEAFDKGWPE